MDVKDLKFQDGSFDVVIDKSLLDAIVCGEAPVENAARMMKEIYRVLSPVGTYFCISHAKGSHRKKYFKNPQKFNWKITKKAIVKPGLGAPPKQPYRPTENDEKDKKHCHFIYTCKK